MMERNIPDVRDIFGRHVADPPSARQKQEVRAYEYSPRSRRRHDVFGSFANDERQEFADSNRIATRSTDNHRRDPNSSGGKKPTKNRSSIPNNDEHKESKGRKGDDQRNVNNRNRDSAHYSTRTLTERDIRHLERHLSMKKTIRKQISRNLAQAFVEDPNVLQDDQPPAAVPSKVKPEPDRSFTLTRAKVSRSEQNVLELLKDNEPDSGHCSPDQQGSSDDDTVGHEENGRKTVNFRNDGKKMVSRPVVDNRSKKDQQYKDDSKFSSFWKMFSVKNKGKR